MITIRNGKILTGLTLITLILAFGSVFTVSIINEKKAEAKNLLAIQQQKKQEEEEAKANAVVIYKDGDNGTGVLELQKKLYNIGYDITVDGEFGNATVSIIKQLQLENNLTQSGNYDKGTETCLNSKEDIRNYDKDHSEKAEKQRADLENKIKKYIGSSISRVGFVYYDLTTGEEISINSNKICVAASTYKVGMNMIAYDWVRSGKLSLSEELKYNSSYFEAGTGILQNEMDTTLKNPVNVQKLLDYSIIYSDNIATKMIQARLGGGQAVRQAVCDVTGINITTSQNVITPEIELRLLKMLYENRQDKYNSHLITIMKQTIFHDRIDKYIPKSLTAHKIGNYGTYVNDVGIVFTDKPYIFIMYVDGLSDSAEKIAHISKMVYDYQLKK